MHTFFSLHSQGFMRVAACTPRIAVADPIENAKATLELLREGEAQAVDMLLFPELGLSAYAIDDLFLQDALLDGVERAIAELVSASQALRSVFVVGAPIRRNQRLYNCACRDFARQDPRSCAEVVSAELSRVL